MPRPRIHPPTGAGERIKTLAAAGHSIIGIAAQFGVSKDTLKRWLDEDPTLQEAFELGRESERQELHAAIVASAKQGKAANVNAFFLLKAKHGYIEENGKSKAGDVSVVVNNVLTVVDHGSDEEWAAKAAEQQRRLASTEAVDEALIRRSRSLRDA